MSGRLVAVCLSARKGEQKQAVAAARAVVGLGLEGDAHAQGGDRQVSLLDEASIDGMRAEGVALASGAFGENLVVQGLDLAGLAIGARLRVGATAELELTRRGKECHAPCAIYRQVGRCIMPTEGLFARVVRAGELRPGDEVVAV
ncbi:MAG TPA: MOSC domain-containing protein [Myxococcota bacterium]|nr:MOSC domain-containing protein [Myxococcota bacterium]HRY96843.1 MOSC domain-containing protein [Myxococcota bacterium]